MWSFGRCPHEAVAPWVQASKKRETLTTGWGSPVDNNRDSLTAGPRGPILLSDVHLIDKLAHFDRERIPERVVHAKGAGDVGRAMGCQSVGRGGPWARGEGGGRGRCGQLRWVATPHASLKCGPKRTPPQCPLPKLPLAPPTPKRQATPACRPSMCPCSLHNPRATPTLEQDKKKKKR